MRHYSTASIVKTEELLLGLPPSNLGDLFATDLRDMFQPTYNGITTKSVIFTKPQYVPTKPGRRIWSLANLLDNSGPDRDSARLGLLTRLSKASDDLYKSTNFFGRLTPSYRKQQNKLYSAAAKIAHAPHREADDFRGYSGNDPER